MPLTRSSSSQSIPSYINPPYQNGIGAYYWMHTASSAVVSTGKPADVNGKICALPWIIPNAITLTQVGMDVTNVTNVDAGAVLRFGLYSDSGGYTPSTLIRDLGTIPADATSVTNPTFTSAFSLNILPGIYWVAMAYQGMATARPTTGTITTASTTLDTFTSLASSRAIPLINGTHRTFFSWTPTTNPVFTAVSTSFAVVPVWGGGLATDTGVWPRYAIRIV